MRVAMISFHASPLADLGPAKAGGMNAYILALGRELGRRKIQVDCFTRRGTNPGPIVQQAGPGFRVVSLPAGPPCLLPPSSLLPFLGEFGEAIEAFRHEEDGRYDLLHAHYYLSGAVASTLKQRWQVPLVFMYHTLGPLNDGVIEGGDPKEPPWRRSLEQRVAQEADLIVAASPHEKDSIQRFYSPPADRLRVIPCGVDVDLFRPLDRQDCRHRLGIAADKILLFVGRLERIKGIDLLLQAFRRLLFATELGAEPLPQLLLVGGNGETDGWRRQARELGVSQQVRFCGPQPASQLPLFYGACDAVIIPSRYESFSLVALEAASCARPLIATSVGGLASAVQPGQNALLVPPQDVDGLAAAMRRVLTDEQLSASLGKRGREWAQGFSWCVIADRILQLYQSLLAVEVRRQEDEA
jgi:D-inositol-3-phosphate glycosyltransferase